MSAKTMRYLAALTTFLLATNAVAQNNYALGPVETSKSKTDVVILGQRFALDANTRCKIRGKVVSQQACVLSLARDTYAAVEGDSLKLDRAAAITVFPFSYVPGASTVMVGGRVSAVRAEFGTFKIGSLQVDNTALLANGAVELSAGRYVETAGVQPLQGGLILASGIRYQLPVVSSEGGSQLPKTIEIVGSQTITGTGIQTITGTGIQTITGTGIQTITGTGTQTITGTGAQTITGTGAQTITGTGAQTITGTGAQTITGTGAQTITGTGAQTITGTGAQTITGTGAQTITGTGTQTITGTGAQSQTITGTGKQTITGTGVQTITGTGTQTITGTGAQTQTITGTGK